MEMIEFVLIYNAINCLSLTDLFKVDAVGSCISQLQMLGSHLVHPDLHCYNLVIMIFVIKHQLKVVLQRSCCVITRRRKEAVNILSFSVMKRWQS